MYTYTPNRKNVKPLGRTEPLADGLWLAFSGSGATFTFTGSYCAVTIAGDQSARPDNTANAARIAIEVDGQRLVDDQIDAPEKTYTLVNGGLSRPHSVTVIKLSETAMSTCEIRAIALDTPTLEPALSRPRRIEFIGDSITCGYGIDDPYPTHPFSTATEDVTKAYAYLTAKALDADYSMVSISGYGIISGYTADGNTKVSGQTIQPYYPTLGFCHESFGGLDPSRVVWDFSQFIPDLIVLNLGTNDDSYTLDHKDRQEEYSSAYSAFLRTVRYFNPGAFILCALGIMTARLCPFMEKAAALYREETGDQRISCLRFDEQLPSDGYSSDWHPSTVTQEKAAQRLTEAVRQLMLW